MKIFKEIAVSVVSTAVKDIKKWHIETPSEENDVKSAVRFLKNYENTWYSQVFSIKKSLIDGFLEGVDA